MKALRKIGQSRCGFLLLNGAAIACLYCVRSHQGLWEVACGGWLISVTRAARTRGHAKRGEQGGKGI
jgi:hypothetical protein